MLERELRERVPAVAEHARRHPHLLALSGVVAGLALSPLPLDAVLLPAAAAAAAITAMGAPRLACAVVVLMLLAATVGQLRLAAIDRPGERLAPGSRLEAVAHILERPRPSAFGSQALVKVVEGPARGARLLARAGELVRWPARGEPGTELRLAGRVAAPRRRPGASFDFAAHLRRRGVAGELAVAWLRGTGERRGGVEGVLDGIRRRAERGLRAGASSEHAALARGMVLGQDEAISPLVRDDFRMSGLAHLLSACEGRTLIGALEALLARPWSEGPRLSRLCAAAS